MGRTELLSLIKGATIEDLLETDPTRKDAPLVICGFRTTNGYTVFLKPIPGSDSVAISMVHEPYEAEKASFMEKLNKSQPDTFFDFRNIFMTLDEIRQLSDEHRKNLKVGGGANEIWSGNIRVRFDEQVLR